MNRRQLLGSMAASGLYWQKAAFAQTGQGREAAAISREDFAKVVPRRLVFPKDHGAHPAFRTEWWYLTAWMQASTDGVAAGRNGSDSEGFGLQLTFFRRRTGLGESNPSRFAPRQLLLAHAAVSLPTQGLYRHDERAGRVGVADVRYSENTTDLGLNGWTFKRLASGQYLAEFTLRTRSRLRLGLYPRQPPTLRGVNGLSQKGPGQDYASYYYSHTHMRVELEAPTNEPDLRLPARSQGLGWFDHEWSSSILPPGAVGWDWIGIHLLNGGSLMAFQLRSRESKAVWTEFDERDAQGNRTSRSPSTEVQWQPIGQWRSPNSLAVYPRGWILQFEGERRRLEIRPVMPNQEFDGRSSTGIVYWEGAVELYESGQRIGRGYLEMTGYAQAMEL